MKIKSSTAAALALVQQGMTMYAAAKQAGIPYSTVRRALARELDPMRCPCCGQRVSAAPAPKVTAEAAARMVESLTSGATR